MEGVAAVSGSIWEDWSTTIARPVSWQGRGVSADRTPLVLVLGASTSVGSCSGERPAAPPESLLSFLISRASCLANTVSNL